MLGIHIVAELYGIKREILNSPEFLRKTILHACKKAKASVIDDIFHKFSPCGVTGIVAIAESHISIHTWPEHSYAAVDVFSCRKVNPEVIIKSIIKSLKPENFELKKIGRGSKVSKPAKQLL